MKKLELYSQSVKFESGQSVSMLDLASLLGAPTPEIKQFDIIGRVLIESGHWTEIENEFPQDDFVQIAYKQDATTGEILTIFIGSKYTRGIYAQYNLCDKKCYACYAHGNCGKNYASGGTWTSSSHNSFDSLEDCLNYRFSESIQNVSGIAQKDAYLMESRALGREIKKRLLK